MSEIKIIEWSDPPDIAKYQWIRELMDKQLRWAKLADGFLSEETASVEEKNLRKMLAPFRTSEEDFEFVVGKEDGENGIIFGVWARYAPKVD